MEGGTAKGSSCESLVKGAMKLQEQPQPSTPKKPVKLEFPDEEQVEVLSPETAKLVKGLGDSPESVQLKAEILRAANELKRGFSSGSAGGSPFPKATPPVETPEATIPAPSPESTVPTAPNVSEQDVAKGPEKEFVREAEMLCDVQTRMQQFEQEMMDEVMKRKRKLEDDMKQEIETKRLKFQKDIEDLETEKIDRERRLQLMEGQLKERMQLVADEQTQLDELKEKNQEMRNQLETTALKVKTMNSELEQQEIEKQKELSEKDEKERQKEMLRRKIQERKQNPAESAAPTAAEAAKGGDVPPEIPTNPTPQGIVPVSDQRFTSGNCPQAWHQLYRITRKKDGCHQEIYEAWHEGGARRDQLLKDFVCRCFSPQDDVSNNKAKLNALITLRQKTKQWRRNLAGYSWKTEEELLAPPLSWSRLKVDGAMKHCTARKLTKKCLYTGSSKFLVQVTDDVEAGDERMKELEHEMKEVGLFDSEFGLGDVLGEEIEDPNKVAPEAKTKPKKLPDFPTVEGQESLPEYIGQYKRACLNRKALLKSTKDRLIKDKAQGYETDFKILEDAAGELNNLYADITKIEVTEAGRQKGAYADTCNKIRSACVKFTNVQMQVKTYFSKSAAKSKSKAKEPQEKDPDDKDPKE